MIENKNETTCCLLNHLILVTYQFLSLTPNSKKHKISTHYLRQLIMQKVNITEKNIHFVMVAGL